MARYYEINEAEARAAHEANSMREFKAGSETEGYRAQVDEAYRMAEEQAERFLSLRRRHTRSRTGSHASTPSG